MSSKKSANERTFQGIFLSITNKILEQEENILFKNFNQEQNIGQNKQQRFADGLLTSRKDVKGTVLFEFKNSAWDAADEELVRPAAYKAFENSYKYFITGTPRELIIWETFKEVPLPERKFKSYQISTFVRKDDDILSPNYEKEVTPKIKEFLKDLSNIVHKVVTKVQWDSIDKLFVNKLSNYILQATESMYEAMQEKITSDKKFQNRLSAYLKEQDIFNVSQKFDNRDAYNICQLSNYLLYLKILFYTHLERDLLSLNLKPLVIPDDKKLLSKTLRKHFNDVLKHDFEKIFEENILEEFEFTSDFIPELRRNVAQFANLDFSGLNADIIGSIYNTLIDNQEQHDRGQHFTNINEVDIVNGFCIRENTKFVLDSGCGAGTFLVRAYLFLKKYTELSNKEISHEELLERIWGIEIAAFPVFLSTMNLCLLDFTVLDNYPCVIHSNFLDVTGGYKHEGYFLNKSNAFEVTNIDNRKKNVTLPIFDACVGNPPYIRQENITRKDDWLKTTEKEWSIKKINKQSDLYVYYLMHTASLLKDGGRLGYVVSASWLDASFGSGFQKYLLDNFKIITIIDHQRKRSFDTASINTVILILEKCSKVEQRKERENNTVRFVRFYANYENFIGNSQDQDRFQQIKSFTQKIENTNKETKNDDFWLIPIKQELLEQNSTVLGKYLNGNWGAKYLRAPSIYYKLINTAKEKFISLDTIVDVKYGIKTGANDFFYLRNDTERALEMDEKAYLIEFGVSKEKHQGLWKSCSWYYSEMTKQHHIIEQRFVVPLFKTQSEAERLDVNVKKLKGCVFMCNENKNRLANTKAKALDYIKIAEQVPYEINKVASVSSRELWYSLASAAFVGDFIFPSKIGEKYRLIDNRKAQVYCDKVSYAIKVKEQYEQDTDIIFALLNSITFRFLVDLFSRQMTGAQTLSDVDVNVVERTLILKPTFLHDKRNEIKEIISKIKQKETNTIFIEAADEDKKALDLMILEAIGLTKIERNELYKAATDYVQERTEKSNSVKTVKIKQKLTYEEAIAFMSDRFADLTKYNTFLKGKEVKIINIPLQKAKYPKDEGTMLSIFQDFNVYFPEGNKQMIIKFENAAQIKLFRFFNETLEYRGKQIRIPASVKDCEEIFRVLQLELKENIESISHLLKTHRSKANPLTIYKDLILK